MSSNSPNNIRKGSKKSQTKKMSVYSMVPTLFILERPSPYKNLNSSRPINNDNNNNSNQKHPLSESYTPINENDVNSSFPDNQLNNSSNIEEYLGDSERSSYKLTVTSNNDDITSSIGKIDGHLKRNCGLELTMEESKEELEINMKFATRCLISSLNIEFLTSIGKPRRLYTPRSAKSSREFTNNIIHEELHEEPEIYNEDIINNESEFTRKNENRYINGDRSKETADLNNTLNSIDDRFKDKNFDKEYNTRK